MKRKKVTLDVFEEAVLPQLQAKHADAASLQKAIDDGYDIFEEAEDGTKTTVKYTVSAAKKADDADKGAKDKKDEPKTKTVTKTIEEAEPVADQVKRLVTEALAEFKKEGAGDGKGAKALNGNKDANKKFTIPAEVKRVGALKYFKNTKVGEFEADERAYRFGMWALAARGSKAATEYCQQYGIGLHEAKMSDDIVAKLHQENVNTAGGFLVPEEFGTDLIELKETYGVARRLFQKESMSSDTKTLPRRTGGLTASFVAEGAAGTESTMTWDQVRLIAKDLMVLTRLTNQVNADSVISWADRLAYECSYANTLKEDQCAFIGTGTSTYGGIQGVSAALSRVWGTGTAGTGVGLVKQGTGTTWGAIVLADFDNVVGSLPQYADTPNCAWVMHRTFYYSIVEKLIQAQGGVPAYETRQGQRAPRPIFKGYPVEFAQVLPSTTASAQVSAYLGDYTLGCTFGDRQQDSIAFSDQASIGGQSMWERNEMGVRCMERFDIVVHDIGDGTTVGPIVGLITG